VSRFLDCHAKLLGRALGEDEIERVRFAFQMVRGTLNNTLMNQPGPFQLEDECSGGRWSAPSTWSPVSTPRTAQGQDARRD
jgi:hypothetical protein